MLKTIGVGFTLLVAVGATAPAQAGGVTQLVTNGDFETTAYGAGGSGQISPSNGTQDVTGWTMGGRSNAPTTPGLGFVYSSGQGDSTSNGTVHLYGPQNGVSNGLTANSGYSTAGGTNGGNYLALDADPQVSGTLSQTINGLTVGYGYVLTFAWATGELADVNYGITTDQFQVSLGSQTQSTQVLTTASQGFDPWRQVTMYFTATAASETLSFLAVGSPSGEPPTALLDAVSLTYAPEPSTWGVMLAGLVGLAAFTAMRRGSAEEAPHG